MPVSIKREGQKITVRIPLGEAMVLQVHRPLAAPFNIGSAMREAAWGLLQINARKLLENFKPAVVTSVIEEDSVVVVFDERPPEPL